MSDWLSGMTLLRMLDITSPSGTPENEIEMLAGSLGTHALNLLMRDKLLERNTFSGLEVRPEGQDIVNKFAERKIDIRVTKKNPISKVITTLDNLTPKANGIPTELLAQAKIQANATHAFIRDVRYKGKLPKKVRDLVNAGKGSRSFIDNLLGSESRKVLPTTDINDAGFTDETKSKSDIPLSDAVVEQLDAASKVPRIVSSLLSRDPDNPGIITRLQNKDDMFMAKLDGYVDMDNERIHVDDRESVQAKNEGIVRDMESALEHVDTIQGGDVNLPFYKRFKVWSNERIGEVSNGWNAQSSKMHRALESNILWKNTFDPTIDSDERTAFMYAVGQALGVKVDKLSGKTAKQEFFNLLADEKMQRAIQLVKSMTTDSDYTLSDDEQAELLKFIGSKTKAGEGTQYFKALSELAMYDAGVPFDSYMSAEVDGVTSGPTITIVQMNMGHVEIVDQLQRGGILLMDSEYSSSGEASEFSQNDTYKAVTRTAHEIMKKEQEDLDKVAAKEAAAGESGGNQLVAKLYRNDVALLNAVLGSLVNDEETIQGLAEVSGTGRQVVKEPVTANVFGAGAKTLDKTMGAYFVEQFKAKTVEYADMYKQATTDTERATIQAAADKMIDLANVSIGFINKKAIIAKEPNADYTKVSITGQREQIIASAIESTFAKATTKSIDEHFKHSREIAQKLQSGLNMAQGLYKLAYEAEKRMLLAEQNAEAEAAGTALMTIGLTTDEKRKISYQTDLTRDQRKIIEERLAVMFPMIHSPSSLTEGNPDKGISAFSSGVQGNEEGNVLTGTDDVALNADGTVEREELFSGVRGNAAVKTPIEYASSQEKHSRKSMSFRGRVVDALKEGIGGLAKAAHSQDAIPATYLLDKYGMINAHDGFSAGAAQMAAMGQEANQQFLYAMADYSSPEELLRGILQTVDAFHVVRGRYADDITAADLKAVLPKEKNEKDKLETITESPTEWLEQLASQVNYATKVKLETLSKVKVMDQYYYPGSAYEVTDEERMEFALLADGYNLLAELNDLRSDAVEPFPGDKPADQGQRQAEWLDLHNAEVDPDDVAKVKSLKAQKAISRAKKAAAAKTAAANASTTTPLAPTNADKDNGIARSRRNAPSGPLEYNTTEVFDALNSNNELSLEESTHLKSLLTEITNKLYDNSGIQPGLTRADMGETVDELAAKHTLENIGPFSSNLKRAGIKLTRGQAFVAEQIEMTMQESLAAQTLPDNGMVRLYQLAKKSFDEDGKQFYDGDWSQATDYEKQHAKRAYDLIFTANSVRTGTPSDQISRFIALGLVHPGFRAQLAQINEPAASRESNEKLGAMLERQYNTMVLSMSNALNGVNRKTNTVTKLERLAKKLAMNEHKKRIELARETPTQEAFSDGVLRSAASTAAEAAAKVAKSAALKNSNIPLVEPIRLATELVAEERVTEVVKMLQQWRDHERKNVRETFIGNLINELQGEVDENSFVYDLLGWAKKIEQDRKEVKDNIQNEIITQFLDSEKLPQKRSQLSRSCTCDRI